MRIKKAVRYPTANYTYSTVHFTFHATTTDHLRCSHLCFISPHAALTGVSLHGVYNNKPSPTAEYGGVLPCPTKFPLIRHMVPMRWCHMVGAQYFAPAQTVVFFPDKKHVWGGNVRGRTRCIASLPCVCIDTYFALFQPIDI